MKRFYILILLVFCCQLIDGQILYADTAQSLGVDESCGDTFLGNGVSFLDYNDDGWDDLTLTTGFGLPLRFFKNVNGTYVEEFLNIPVTNYQTKQVNWVDIDNDGDKDLFVTSDTNGNRLYENDGSFNFTDITASAGISSTNMLSYGASWGDINNDGYLDVYISNRDFSMSSPNKLYKNNGNNTFTDISSSAGVDLASFSFCSAFFDFNNDGFQDIYISIDKSTTKNVLYKNNGDETFTNIAESSNTNIAIDAMSVTVGDYNKDGWFDLYITNGIEGNVFLRNNGDETFTDITASTGTSFNSVGWGAVFLDADNDEDLDLYVSGDRDGSEPGLLSAAFYENLNGIDFEIPTNAGFDTDMRHSYSNAIGDVDNDGLPDIVVSNTDQEDIFLWNNQTTTSNNWLKVKLEGTTSNRDGIGSVIEISANGQKQYQYTNNGEGYLGQNSDVEFFGLGSNTIVDYVKVTWLSGTVDNFNNVSVNQLLEITEGSGTLSVDDFVDNQAFKIYPNPAENVLNIESNFNEIESIEIFEITGKLLLKKHVNSTQNTIDISLFNSGLYLLKINSETSTRTYKFVRK